MASYLPRKLKTKTGAQVVLRSATVEDAAALNKLARDVFATSPHVVTTPEEFADVTDEKQQERVRKFEAEPHDLILVVESEGRLVGNLDFQAGRRKKVAHCGTIGMSTHARWRNQGVGRILLDGLIEWVKSHPHLEVIQLGVFEENSSAIALYSSVGFETIGRNEFAFKENGRYFTELTMILRVR